MSFLRERREASLRLSRGNLDFVIIKHMNNFHTPVLLKEALDNLNIKSGHWYVDCNLGGGGHTEEILKRGGKVIGIDLDREAIKEVANKYKIELQEINGHLEGYSKNLILIQANFINLDQIILSLQSRTDHPSFLKEIREASLRDQSASRQMAKQSSLDNNSIKIARLPDGQATDSSNPRNDGRSVLLHNDSHEIKISGILFDLGFSSHQMNTAESGFSFGRDGTLDMRMDQTSGASAKDLVNGLYEKELTEIFQKYGEERKAREIAKRIISYRLTNPIESTNQLAKIVESVKHRRPQDKIHPATQIFQALRIAVNDELRSLEITLPKAFEILERGGRIVVISFHSLEERIVKNYFRELENDGLGKNITDKPIEPTQNEVGSNPRSRSAKMRVIEKK